MLLLPPSEGKAPGGDGPPWAEGPQSFPGLNARRRTLGVAVRRALRTGDEAARGRLLGARGDLLADAAAGWRAVDRAATLPAWRRYRGVVWDALDPGGLDPVARAALLERVHVPSGAFGLLAAGDAVPPYRLKMAASVPGIGRLAAWWRPRIAPLIAGRAGGGWIVDLLPSEHAAALDVAAIAREGARLARVALVTGEDRASARAAGHAGKHAKGLLAQAILTHDARSPEELAALTVPGLRTLAVTAEGPVHTVTIRIGPAAG